MVWSSVACELARRLHEIVLPCGEILVLCAHAHRCSAHEKCKDEPEDAEDHADRVPDRSARVGDDRRHDGVVERDLRGADGAARGCRERCPNLHDRPRLPDGVDLRGTRLAKPDRPSQVRARAHAADTIGPGRGEDEPAAAGVHVHAFHVVRQPERAPQPSALRRRQRDVAAVDDSRGDSGVDVCTHVAAGVLQDRRVEVAREPRGESDGADREDDRGHDEKRPEQRQRTPEAVRAVLPHPTHASCIGQHKGDFERLSTIGRRGPRRRLPRDVRLHADAEAGSVLDARAPRRRAAPLRLRRGHATTTSAQRRRPRRARRDLPDALPRRPLPGASGHAQDVRAARARGSVDDLRARAGSATSSAHSGGSSAG